MAKRTNPEPAGKAGPKAGPKANIIVPPDAKLGPDKLVVFTVAGKVGKPKTAYPSDAGHDMKVSDYTSIRPHTRVRIKHGIKLAIPPGHVGLVLPRSSTFDRLGILINPGVIDPGFRGEVMALAFNPTEKMVHINEGDRVAQLLILPVAQVEFVSVDELPEGDRGDNGFGSTTETPAT